MVSRRLTKDDRDLVLRRLLIHAFREQVDDLIVDMASYASKVYNDVYPTSTGDQMAALPEGWLPAESGMEVRFGPLTYLRLSFNGMTSIIGPLHKVCTKREPVYRRMWSKHVRHCVKVYDYDHSLSSMWSDLADRREVLKKSIEEADSRARAVLNSCTTTNNLVKIWPEVEPYLDQPKKIDLPVVPIQEINQLLHLGGSSGT